MAVSDLPGIAAMLRQEGFEARNLGGVGLSVWRNGQGLFLTAEEVARLNGDIVKEVEGLLNTPDRFARGRQ